MRVLAKRSAWQKRAMTRLFLVPLSLTLSACPPVEGDDDDAPPPPPVVSLGGITLRQEAASYQVSAFFHEPAVAEGCTSEEVAGCTLSQCEAATDPVTAATLDAGAITVQTETVAEENVSATLTVGGDDRYDSVAVSEAVFFANAEELSASTAGGADIGALAFELVAPTRIQLTAPPLQAVNVRVTSPIDVAWSNSSAGDVTAKLSQADASFTRLAMCTAPASAAALTIPAAVIGRFPIGGGQLVVEVATTTTASIDATHSAFFSAVSSVTSPTGGAGQYNVFFESP
jgi:hypothetical protein